MILKKIYRKVRRIVKAQKIDAQFKNIVIDIEGDKEHLDATM